MKMNLEIKDKLQSIGWHYPVDEMFSDNSSELEDFQAHNTSMLWPGKEDYHNHNISWFSADDQEDVYGKIPSDDRVDSFVYDAVVHGILVCLFTIVGVVMVVVFCLILVQECKVSCIILYKKHMLLCLG